MPSHGLTGSFSFWSADSFCGPLPGTLFFIVSWTLLGGPQTLFLFSVDLSLTASLRAGLYFVVVTSWTNGQQQLNLLCALRDAFLAPAISHSRRILSQDNRVENKRRKDPDSNHFDHGILPYLSSTSTSTASLHAGLPFVNSDGQRSPCWSSSHLFLTASFLWAYHINFSLRDFFLLAIRLSRGTQKYHNTYLHALVCPCFACPRPT